MFSNIELGIASVSLFAALYHGTFDWVALPRLYGWSVKTEDLIQTTLLYVSFSIPYILLWIIHPGISMFIFLIFTAIHMGQEDLYFSTKATRAYMYQGNLHKLMSIVGRGGFVVTLPMVLYLKEYRFVVNELLSLFNESGSMAWYFNNRLLFIAIPVSSAIAYTIITIRGTNDIHYIIGDSNITLIYAGWFTVLPIAISIPVYVAFVHSPMHMKRLYNVGINTRRKLFKYSLPYTFGSIIFFYFIIIYKANSIGKPMDIVLLYLVMLSILTVPHTLITYIMDKDQGVY